MPILLRIFRACARRGWPGLSVQHQRVERVPPLLARVVALVEDLEPETLEDHDVMPVLATPWRDDHLTEEDRASAREKGVALLTRENLEKLEDMALRNVGRREALAFIRRCVPSNQAPEIFGVSGS